MKKLLRYSVLILLATAILMSFSACSGTLTEETEISDTASETETIIETEHTSNENARTITLYSDSASIDGETIEEYDYTWHCDPSVSHNDVEDAPAEYYTGTKPETAAAVYIDHELFYFPELPESGFELVNYDGENEWAYHYTDGEHDDYIFATLPSLGNALPTQMMHSEEEALKNKVLHITEAGTYVLEGEWQGQIWVDLGDRDETFADETAKVTLILNGAKTECSVAPGVVFYSAYECDNTWEEKSEWSQEVHTDDAGVTVVIADDSENSVSGTNVFRMLKTKYKEEDSDDAVKAQKKLRKTDAAFYSYVTMNIEGEAGNTGTLTVDSGFEGLDSELHLSFNGGNITINSQDDGINVNEDHVSVVSFNGSDVTINAAQGAEGDGVDSNGFIVINGGKISVNGIVRPDSALDSEDGIYYNAGTVVIDGEEQQYSSGDVFRESEAMGGPMNDPGQFGQRPDDMGERQRISPPEDFDIQEFKEQVAALGDDATFEDVLALLGMNHMMPDEQQPQEPPASDERP